MSALAEYSHSSVGVGFPITIWCYFILCPVFVSTPVWRNFCMISNGKYNFEDKNIFPFLQCFRLQSFLYWKDKNHFSTCTYIKHTLFPEGSTKTIRSSTSHKDLSTTVGNKKKGIVSTLIDWLNFCSDMSFTSVMVIV